MQKSLKKDFFRTIIFSIFCAFIIIFILMIIYINYENNYHLKLSKTLLLQTFSSYKGPISSAYFERRYIALKYYGKQIESFDLIFKVDFFDKDMKLIESVMNESEKKEKTYDFKKFKKIKKDKYFYILEKGLNRVLVYFDSITIFNERFGYIKIYYDISQFSNRKLTILIILTIIMLLLLFSLLFLINRYLKNLVINPLNYFRKTIKNIINERYGEQIEIKKENEIGELARIYNKMSIKLKENIDLKEKLLEELKNSQKFLDLIFNTIRYGIVVVNSDFKIIRYNFYFKKIIKSYYSDKELHLKPIEFFFSDFKERKSEIYKKLISNEIDEYFFEGKFIDKILNFYIYKFEFKNEYNILILFNDVTLVKENEKKLARKQKFELVGQLASGIAHDFNNIIGEISGNISLIDWYLKEINYKKNTFRQIYKNMKDIIFDLNESINRAKDTTTQLLGISKNKVLQKLNYNIVDSFKSIIKLLKRTIDKSIIISLTYEKNEIYVYADKSLIEVAIMNVCINAVHAMTILKNEYNKWGGNLDISLGIIEGTIKEVNNNNIFIRKSYNTGKDNKKYCKIEIKDNGVGIKPENINKIFDPLFTTKKEKEGTGLGLAMVRNTIYSNGGAIEVSSIPDKGTTFVIYLPVINKEIINKNNYGNKVVFSKEKDKLKKIKSLNLFNNVLIIDDENNYLKIFDKMLTNLGFNPFLANCGQIGLQFLKNNKIDLIIVDLVLPEISGEILIEKFLKINKNVKIILTSGAIDNRIDRIIKKYDIQFLKKPFDYEEFINIIQDTLNLKI